MASRDLPQQLYRFSWSEDWRGLRLKALIRKLLPALGSRASFQVIDNGLVYGADGKAITDPDVEFPEGSVISIDLRHGAGGRGRPKRIPLKNRVKVLFEDSAVVVVSKSAGILSAPVEKEKDTRIKRKGPPLTESLQHYWRATGGEAINPILVQRLDVETSGLMVLAKTEKAAILLQKQFKPPRTLERTYLAIVAGTLTTPAGVWKSYLGRGRNDIRQTVADVRDNIAPPRGAQYAETAYEVVEALPGATLLRLKLATGRTHQIRIHCAEAGHPVLGDDHYRSLADLVFERFVKKDWKVLTPANPSAEARALFDAGQQAVSHPAKAPRRIALHATKLAFRHPLTGKRVEFDEALPPDMDSYLALLRRPAPAPAAKGRRQPEASTDGKKVKKPRKKRSPREKRPR